MIFYGDEDDGGVLRGGGRGGGATEMVYLPYGSERLWGLILR